MDNATLNSIKGLTKLAAFALLAELSSPAQLSAQTAPPTASASLSALNHFDSSSDMQQDFVLGTVVKGPYQLGWRGIVSGSETVLRDGVVLQRGVDYTVDCTNGTISFTSPLQPQQIVRVSYKCDASLASPSSASAVIPFVWSLLRSGKSTLNFNTLFRSQNIESGKALISSLTFTGKSQSIGGSTLSSAALLDLQGGNWLDKSGLMFGDKYKDKHSDLSLNLSRGGNQFTPGSTGVAGITAGKEVAEFIASVKPLTNLTFNTTFRDTVTLANPSIAGSASSSLLQEGGNFALSLPRNLKISGGLNDTVLSDSTGVTRTLANNAKVDSDLPGKSHVTATFDATQVAMTPVAGSGTAASSSYTQKSALAVSTKAVDQVTLNGSVSNVQSTTGNTDSGSLALEATPFHKDKKLAKVKITAGVSDQVSSTAGSTQSGTAKITVPTLPVAQASFTGGLVYSSNPQRSLTVGQLDATAKPVKFVEVSGGARLRDGSLADSTPDPNAVNGYQMKLAIGPSPKLKLTGSYATNPDAADGSVRRTVAQNLGIESDLRLVKFTGQVGYEQDYINQRLSNSMVLGFDLRLSKRDTITTGWEGRSVQDTVSLNETYIYRLGYTHKLGSALDVSLTGSMTQNYLNGTFNGTGPDVKAEAKIGIHF